MQEVPVSTTVAISDDHDVFCVTDVVLISTVPAIPHHLSLTFVNIS